MLLACDGPAGVVAKVGTAMVEMPLAIDQEKLSRSAAEPAKRISRE